MKIGDIVTIQVNGEWVKGVVYSISRDYFFTVKVGEEYIQKNSLIDKSKIKL